MEDFDGVSEGLMRLMLAVLAPVAARSQDGDAVGQIEGLRDDEREGFFSSERDPGTAASLGVQLQSPPVRGNSASLGGTGSEAAATSGMLPHTPASARAGRRSVLVTPSAYMSESKHSDTHSDARQHQNHRQARSAGWSLQVDVPPTHPPSTESAHGLLPGGQAGELSSTDLVAARVRLARRAAELDSQAAELGRQQLQAERAHLAGRARLAQAEEASRRRLKQEEQLARESARRIRDNADASMQEVKDREEELREREEGLEQQAARLA